MLCKDSNQATGWSDSRERIKLKKRQSPAQKRGSRSSPAAPLRRPFKSCFPPRAEARAEQRPPLGCRGVRGTGGRRPRRGAAGWGSPAPPPRPHSLGRPDGPAPPDLASPSRPSPRPRPQPGPRPPPARPRPTPAPPCSRPEPLSARHSPPSGPAAGPASPRAGRRAPPLRPARRRLRPPATSRWPRRRLSPPVAVPSAGAATATAPARSAYARPAPRPGPRRRREPSCGNAGARGAGPAGEGRSLGGVGGDYRGGKGPAREGKEAGRLRPGQGQDLVGERAEPQ